jgi:hypothetical protein
MATFASVTVTAQNQWSDPVRAIGYMNASIQRADNAVGTLAGSTVTVQRSTDGTTWRDVDRWTSTAEDVGFEPELLWYRIGVKTAEFGTQNLVLRLGREPGVA